MSKAKEYAEWLREMLCEYHVSEPDDVMEIICEKLGTIAEFIESQAARLDELEPELYANLYANRINPCFGWYGSREAADDLASQDRTHILIRKGGELRAEKVK